MAARPYYDEYDDNLYDLNALYGQYDPNDPYGAQYLEGSPYASQYAESDPYGAGYDPSNQYGYGPFANPYGQPEAPYNPYEDSGVRVVDERSAATGSSGGDPDYYVSLEPCARGSSCSMYEPVDPKCMIRLVGNGYQKDIELSLDSKMDSLVHRIFRCLEDEGICLDGVRLQGLPKKNCLKTCLAALCAPFTALCSGPLTKPACCPALSRPCCCTPITCPKRSLDVSPRQSTASARYSVTSKRPSVCSTRSRRRRPGRRRLPSYRKPSYSCQPCRMAKVCQGPGKDDCVLIKISPSLPKLGGVKCKKRSTAVGTDEFPQLEILLQGGNKKRCATKNKGKICVCPHCCSGGKMKIIKCRSRVPKCKDPHKEKLQERPKQEELPRQEEWPKQDEEWPKQNEEWPSRPASNLDEMSEGEMNSLYGRLEREDDRFSFGQPPPPRSSVNFVLVESRANPFQKSNFIESESHIVLPKKVDVGTNPSRPNCEIHKPIKCAMPLKVYSVHQQTPNGGQMRDLKTGRSGSSKKKGNTSDPERVLIMKEILHLANEILKNQNKKISSESPKESLSVQNKKPGDTPQTPQAKNELNPIFCRSNLWLSGSDVASNIGPLEHNQPSSPSPTTLRRHYSSSKSINFVARLKKRYHSKRSPKKSSKPETVPEFGSRSQDEPCDKFEKLRIYLETDKNDKPAEFVPIELTKKEASVHLNTLVR